MAALIVAFWVSSSWWLSQVCSNIGLLYYRDIILQEYALFSPSKPALSLDIGVSQVNTWLRWALLFNPNNFAAEWGILRVALYSGDDTTALAAAQKLTGRVGRHALAAEDAVLGLITGGALDDAWTLFESLPFSFSTQNLRDAVALAYLQAGSADIRMLERIHRLRPEDIYINYYLWQRANTNGEIQAAAVYSATLAYFSTNAIISAKEHLLDYAVKVIPNLLREGVWEHSTALNVVSYLVWQHSHLASVEHLLQDLSASYPHEAQWSFYLGELYQRRGDWELAEHAYKRGLTIDPSYISVFLRLGMVNEARCGIVDATCNSLETALTWYRHYYELAPNDVIGLRRLSETYAILRTSESDPMLEQVPILLDEHNLVAEMLRLPVTSVDLGPNLLENGDFEVLESGAAKNWEWSDMFNHSPFNAANFIGGIDTLAPAEGAQNVRINGLWAQQEVNKSRARAGFWQRPLFEKGQQIIAIDPDELYVVSFYYRTTNLSNSATATIWISEDPLALWANDYSLPPTYGLWQRFVALGWNCSGKKASIAPLVRLFGVGQAEFDAVRVQLVRLSEPISTCSNPIFYTP